MAGRCGQIIQSGGQHSHCARHEFCRSGTFETMRRHVGHLAVKTLPQPRQQARLCVRQIDATKTDLGESELLPPAVNAGTQLTLIDQPTGVVHPLIVKSLVWPDEAATRLFATALGNALAAAHDPAIVQALRQRADDPNPLVREHVAWALGYHRSNHANG